MRPNCCPPPIPPCPPEPPKGRIDFYAQYGVQASPPSGSNLPMIPIFQEGTQIHLNGNTEIILAPGYLYLINYLLLATTEPDNYMQIVPRINGTLQLLYAFLAPAGSGSRNTSAAGSFTTNAAADRRSPPILQPDLPSGSRKHRHLQSHIRNPTNKNLHSKHPILSENIKSVLTIIRLNHLLIRRISLPDAPSLPAVLVSGTGEVCA